MKAWNILCKSGNYGGKINGFLRPKLFLRTVRKHCFSDREKLLNFEAEGREFAHIFANLSRYMKLLSNAGETILLISMF